MRDHVPRWLHWARDPEQARRVELLATTPVFAGLPRRLLGRLAVRLFEKAYATDEEVFREGDPGKGLFIVSEGTILISRVTPGGEQTLAELGSGDSFGELALIDDAPRSATARAVTPARLLILYRAHFESLVEGHGRFAFVVMRNLLRTLAVYVRRNNSLLVDATGPGAPGTSTVRRSS